MPHANPEVRRAYQREYRERHRERINAYNLARYHQNPEPQKAATSSWRERHPEQFRETQRLWHERNREREQETQRAYRQRNPGLGRRKHLRQAYGLTPTDYDALLAGQGGVCAICGGAPTDRPLDVDHDHSTGRVRGLLCNPCNMRLGIYEWAVRFGEQAEQYLAKAEA